MHRIDDTARRFQRATFYKIFLTNPSLRSALVTSIDKEGIVKHDNIELIFFSSAMYAYVVGVNTIEQKKKKLC